jgi:adenosylcobyric acid synthase
MLQLQRRPEGAVSADGRTTGCYLHGLFASDSFRRNFLARLGAAPSGLAYDAMIDDTLDRLANHLTASLDLDALLAAARPPLLTKAA